jgi:SSS family solute:Na+ symporter
LLAPKNQLQYLTLALFLYPHSVTAILSSNSGNTIRRNMSLLPAYSLVLGLLALLGYMAIAAGIKPEHGDASTIVPLLFDKMFSPWFAGIAFAAVGIGALVPAAIMSIAAANLFTRNVYVEFVRKDASAAEQARVSKAASLVVKFGALAFILGLNPRFAIDLQLIGGVMILQTLPSVALGLYTRRFHRAGLIAGWIAGMVSGLWMLTTVHFASSAFNLGHVGGPNVTIYAGFVAVIVNLIVAVLGTLIARAAKYPEGIDATAGADYHVDRGSHSVDA